MDQTLKRVLCFLVLIIAPSIMGLLLVIIEIIINGWNTANFLTPFLMGVKFGGLIEVVTIALILLSMPLLLRDKEKKEKLKNENERLRELLIKHDIDPEEESEKIFF